MKFISKYKKIGFILFFSASFSLAQSNQTIDEVIVSASLTPLERSETGNSVTIIDGDIIRERGVINISQILRDIPGFAVSQSGGYGAQTQVRARGAESNHLLVLIDGVEANDPSQNDEFVWGTVSIADIEKIEVIRGPQSAISGSDALAGKVNIITRSSDQNGAQVHSQLGSWNTHNSGFNFSRKDDNFHFRAGFSRIDSDGDNISRAGNENDGYQNTTMNLKSGYSLNPQLNVLLTARKSEGTVDYDSDDNFDGLVEDQPKNSDFDNLTAKIKTTYLQADGPWSHSFIIAESRFDNAAYSDGVRGNITASQKSQLQYLGSYAEDSQSLSILIEKEKEDWMQKGEISYGIYDPNQNRVRENDGLALEYRYEPINNLIVGLSGRYEDNSEFGSSSSYRSEFVYKKSEAMRIRGVFGKAIKNPTFTERFGFYTNFLGNPNLVPEESVSAELGLDYTFATNLVEMSFTIFDSDLENEINGFVYDPATFAYTSANISGSSNRKGIEVTMSGEMSNALSFNSSYTYVKSDQQDGETITREIRRPEHMASLGLYWMPLDALNIIMNAQFVGSQLDTFYPPFPQNPENVKLADHTLVDIAINYEMSEKMSVLFKIDNLFNDNYEEVFGYKTLGVGVSVGLRYQM